MDLKEDVLREYVRTVLNEDDGGGDAYGGFDLSSNIGPYGISFGSSKDLYNVFVTPFTDVVKTATGKTKELSVKAQTVAKVAIEGVLSTIIPVLSADYKKIFEKEHQELEKIKSQYKEVYDATWTAFKDNDVAIMAFMYKPTAIIGAKIAQQVPVQTVNLLNILAGGKLDNFFSRVKKAFSLGDTVKPLDRKGPDFGKEPTGGGWDTGMGGIGMESVIREDGSGKKKQNLTSVLNQKGIKQAIESNPHVQKMESAAQTAVNNTLKLVVDRARAVASANNVDDLQKKIGKKFPGSEKLAQVPQEQRAQAEATFMKNVKESVKLMYVKGLEQQVQKATAAGIPKNHPFISAYAQTISQIKQL